jgi:hypothetical protein
MDLTGFYDLGIRTVYTTLDTDGESVEVHAPGVTDPTKFSAIVDAMTKLKNKDFNAISIDDSVGLRVKVVPAASARYSLKLSTK